MRRWLVVVIVLGSACGGTVTTASSATTTSAPSSSQASTEATVDLVKRLIVVGKAVLLADYQASADLDRPATFTVVATNLRKARALLVEKPPPPGWQKDIDNYADAITAFAQAADGFASGCVDQQSSAGIRDCLAVWNVYSAARDRATKVARELTPNP